MGFCEMMRICESEINLLCSFKSGLSAYRGDEKADEVGLGL